MLFAVLNMKRPSVLVNVICIIIVLNLFLTSKVDLKVRTFQLL